jgi:hypothetical protein
MNTDEAAAPELQREDSAAPDLQREDSTPFRNGETLREWSFKNNVNLSHQDSLPEALQYLSELTKFRAKNLEIFVDYFKNDPEAALPHIQLLLAAPANSLASAFSLKRLPRETRIVDVAAQVCRFECVVISGWEDDNGVHPDVLWDQRTLFARILSCTDFAAEVSTILDDVQEVPTLHAASSGIDEVLRVMCASHSEIVGLVNNVGSVESVVFFSEIFKEICKEISRIYFDAADLPGASKAPQSTAADVLNERLLDPNGDLDDDDGILFGIDGAAKEQKTLKQAVAEHHNQSRLQRMSQIWVESFFTDFMIMVRFRACFASDACLWYKFSALVRCPCVISSDGARSPWISPHI